MDTIATKTKTLIADTLGVEEHIITPETDLIRELGADSLDVVELTVILEKEFGVTIPDEKLEHMRKVRHFTEYFEKVRPIPVGEYYGLKAA